MYDLNCICEMEKLQSVTAFSFYSTSKLTFLPKHPITRIYFSSCAIRHFVRAGVSLSPSVSFFPPQMAEISFWDEALHLVQALVIGTGLRYQEAREGGRLNPWRPAPSSGHKPVRVYISPHEFRKIGEINAAAEGRWC